jgi:DNA polymerase-3 subunit epsilon
MRQIVLDTETTGLEVGKGHRIIEIGAVEMLERRITGNDFRRFVNPQRAIDFGAQNVHGIRDEDLVDKPTFREIVREFLAFIDGAELIIHNAAFDVAFLDAELALAGAEFGTIADHATVLDTLILAREKYPGQKNSLDALCKRLNVDNSHRHRHGALLDAELLADVYLAMTGGQGDLAFAAEVAETRRAAQILVRPPLRVRRADAEEIALHELRLAKLDDASKGRCLWRLALSDAAAATAAVHAVPAGA